MKMKKTRITLACVALILFFVPMISAQDLSKYRNFALGSSLAVISKQVNAKPQEAAVIHQTPAVIQELNWWPIESHLSSAPAESVQQIRFFFCNRLLYSMSVTYEDAATKGLTAEDMVQSISAKYGTAIQTVASTNPRTSLSYIDTDEQIALWENSQDSVTLFRSPVSNSFRVVMISKLLKAQADAAIDAALKQEHDDAPQQELARVKKQSDDLEAMRQANLKSFRP